VVFFQSRHCFFTLFFCLSFLPLFAINIGAINFQGISGIEETELIKASGLQKGQEYNPELVSNATSNLYKYLQNKGRYFVWISSPELIPDETGTVSLLFSIQEKAPSDEVKIRFQGMQYFSEAKLFQLLLLSQEKNYRLDQLSRIMQQTLSLYNNRGYLFAKVELDSLVLEEALTAHIGIDEVQKSIPEIEEDWTAIEKAINDRSEEIKTIDREISDLSTRVEGDNEKYLSNLRLLNTKRGELQRLEFDIQFKAGQRYVELNGLLTFNVEKLKSLKAEQERLTRSSQNLEQEKQQYLNERGILLKEWQEISKQKEVFFMEEEFVCPTCKRALEAEDIETKKANLTAAWNTDKAKRLEKNVTKGKEVAAFIQQTTEKITGINQKLVELSNNINATEEKIRADDEELVKAREQKDNWQLLAKDNKDYIELNHVINLLSKSLGAGPVKADISKQTERKEAIQKELTDLIQRLNQKEFTDRAKKRIAELKKGQKDLAQKLADRELVEHNIQGFIKAKIEAIEGKVNSMFSYVSWRMFKQLVNGESEETCEAMINGVPFSDANSGAKIHAGFDIIKVLSKHYGMTAPCFVDNSESLSEFPKTESQTIKLYVTEDETLIIN